MKRIMQSLFVIAVVVLSISIASAQKQHVKAVKGHPSTHGSVTLFTNFVGAYPFWDITTGYFVDGIDFYDQVLAGGFTASSNSTFADVAVAGANYRDLGGKAYGRMNVYLATDAGGVPGTIIDGPLSQQYFLQNFDDGRGGGIVQFNCVTCPSLSSGQTYWVIAQQNQATVQDTWDFALSDVSSLFAFNQTGSINGPWTSIGSGYARMAWQADGN
jgi:hypothetical protein